jgi:hypothetical protein
VKFKIALLAGLASTLALTACETRNPRYLSRASFWQTEVAWSAQPGANSLTGTAMLPLSNTQQVRCGAIPIRLVPDSTYARQRFAELYGSDVAGTATGIGYTEWGPEKGDWTWLEAGKKTTCGPDGSFTFTGAADGTWYVVATWVDSSDPKARSVSTFKRVDLRGGQQATVSLP